VVTWFLSIKSVQKQIVCAPTQFRDRKVGCDSAAKQKLNTKRSISRNSFITEKVNLWIKSVYVRFQAIMATSMKMTANWNNIHNIKNNRPIYSFRFSYIALSPSLSILGSTAYFRPWTPGVSAVEKEKHRQPTKQHRLILSPISEQNVLIRRATLHCNIDLHTEIFNTDSGKIWCLRLTSILCWSN
jgi:hypothetical protein